MFLDKLMLQGYVHTSSLEDDYYALSDDGNALVGRRRKKRFHVGDYIEVMPDKISYDMLEAEFVIAKG
ncbi:MAG TPA: hypothetical protein DCM31_08935 [Deferribacteraceae bacterium]|nr:hypothetical protein [Deferribacteraceae bacterium]